MPSSHANGNTFFRSLARKADKASFHLAQDFYQKNLIAPLPTHIQLEPTVRCNLHCTTCSRDSVIASYQKMNMSLQEIHHILELIPSLKTVKFQGLGEPLFTAEIENILPLFAARKIQLWTITNGTVLKDSKYRRYLTDFFKDVTVSLDSTDEKKFAKIRAGANLRQVEEGLHLLVQDRNEKAPDLTIGINYCVTHENFQELGALADLALKLKLDYVSVVFVENWHTADEAEYLKSKAYVAESQKVLPEIRREIRNLRWKLLQHGIILGSKKETPRLGDCFWPFRSLFINVEGEITPCCVRMHRNHSLGNILKVSNLNEIWNGPAYQALRRAHLQKDKTHSVCGHCPG